MAETQIINGMTIRCQFMRVVPISELKYPHPKQRNKHDDSQVKQLAKILKHQGWRYCVKVSNQTGFVTSGHGRIAAAKLNGWQTIPVDFQDYDNFDMEYQDVQADNAIAMQAELDLAGINADLGELGPFDIDLLGLKDFQIEVADKYGDPDECPAVPECTSVKLGDLFILGEHRLLCGDCTVKENVERLMAGEKADMVFTDPPYNHASGDALIASSVRRSMEKLKNSEWDKNFDINPSLEIIDQVLSDDSSTYIFTSWHLAGDIWKWMAKRSSYSGYCVWHKPNPMPSLMKRHWTWSTELVCYMTRGKHTFNFPSQGHALNLWIHNKEKPSQFEGHPTQKPVDVCLMGIEKSSKHRQIVLDPFLGSGSTLIACEKTNRKCFGMEIDPHYVSVILDRWEKFSGKEAVREDGKSWKEIKGE